MMNPARPSTIQTAFRAAVLPVLVSILFSNTSAFAQGANLTAQDAAILFGGMSNTVKPGDQVTVLRTDRIRLKGSVVDLTPRSITMSRLRSLIRSVISRNRYFNESPCITLSETRTAMSMSLSGRALPDTAEPNRNPAWISGLDWR